MGTRQASSTSLNCTDFNHLHTSLTQNQGDVVALPHTLLEDVNWQILDLKTHGSKKAKHTDTTVYLYPSPAAKVAAEYSTAPRKKRNGPFPSHLFGPRLDIAQDLF